MTMIDTGIRISENTTGDCSSDNPVIRLLRSRFAASIMVCISMLMPIETFAINCALKTAPICIDNTPCKDVLDPNGNTVKVCLSTAVAPVGAMVTSQSCWNYKSTYDCMDQTDPSYSDTCKAAKDNGSCVNYTEKTVSCNNDLPKLSGGACPLFDVTYQCEVTPGSPYTETTCSSNTSCVDKDGKPSFCVGPVSQETNKSFGRMIAGQETARQAGVYADKGSNPGETDPNNIYIFKGEPNRCTEGMWGMAASCCKPDAKGASATNALITEQLLKMGWNSIAQSYVGSDYMFDSLLDQTVDLVTKALTAMTDVMNGVMNGSTSIATTTSNAVGGASGAGGAAGSVSSGIDMVNTANIVGGAVGGAVVGAAAGQWAANAGASTAVQGTAAAVGSTIGTIAGTYATSYAMYAGTALMNGASAGVAAAAGAAGADGAVSALCTPCLVGMLVFAIIMALSACTPEDMKTQLKLGAPGICHYVGTYCKKKDPLGGCITTMQQYCCFNSRIARIIQEGAKGTTTTAGQIGNWGSAKAPNCSGIQVSQLDSLDFSKIDLSEFIDDVVVKSTPNADVIAQKVTDKTRAFFDANATDPTATDGLLVTGSATQLAPPSLPTNDTSMLDNPPPAIMACNVKFAVTQITADGTTSGLFSVDNCNPDAVIVWNNQSNCVDSPATSMVVGEAGFISSVVDANGVATFAMTLPPTCFGITSPPTQNLWKGVVTLQPYGSIGVINAIWQ